MNSPTQSRINTSFSRVDAKCEALDLLHIAYLIAYLIDVFQLRAAVGSRSEHTTVRSFYLTPRPLDSCSCCLPLKGYFSAFSLDHSFPSRPDAFDDSKQFNERPRSHYTRGRSQFFMGASLLRVPLKSRLDSFKVGDLVDGFVGIKLHLLQYVVVFSADWCVKADITHTLRHC